MIALTNETGSKNTRSDFPDPNRSIEIYMQMIGETNTFKTRLYDLEEEQSRFNWKEEVTAEVINDYIREGFGMGRSPARLPQRRPFDAGISRAQRESSHPDG